ncbi:MAG: NAD(P)/FAD-dependent oxidoreductase [Gemmatimonadetes bacterium]|nr:NAD(P)/FAD-dependent oxidoreductase [Gemmatimonadota bacterium]
MTRGPLMPHRVVIVGGGFGGLYAARSLARAAVEVVLVDRRNFHLFQPLLYQVATGALNAGDISGTIRKALKRQGNARVWLGEVVDVDPVARRVLLRDGTLEYDSLIVAAGLRTNYFGHDDWAPLAPGLKTVEDAGEIRRRVLLAFERAEREEEAAGRVPWLTFVIVGAGPTGVELAGTLAELARHTLRGEFRAFDPRQSRVILVEAQPQVLPSFPPRLSVATLRSLRRLGVEVRTGCSVVTLDALGVEIDCGRRRERIAARTVVWAAGVRGESLAQVLARGTGCRLDGWERVLVGPDLTVPGYPDIFVIGDLAHVEHRGAPLAAIAQPAIQEGRYAARLIQARLEGRTLKPFRYFDKGSMATIGRADAVVQFRGRGFSGFFAWLAWLVIHLIYLIEFENRLLVMIQWANHYIMRRRGARLITAGDAWAGARDPQHEAGRHSVHENTVPSAAKRTPVSPP